MRQSLDERYPASASITQLAIGTKRSHDNGIPDMHDDGTRWPDERQPMPVGRDKAKRDAKKRDGRRKVKVNKTSIANRRRRRWQ